MAEQYLRIKYALVDGLSSFGRTKTGAEHYRTKYFQVRGAVGKSDEVRTTDSVIIHLIWPIEELDIRSMSL